MSWKLLENQLNPGNGLLLCFVIIYCYNLQHTPDSESFDATSCYLTLSIINAGQNLFKKFKIQKCLNVGEFLIKRSEVNSDGMVLKRKVL